MDDREYRSARPAEQNLKSEPAQERVSEPQVAPQRNSRRKSSEELWVRQTGLNEETIQSEYNRTSTQKRLLRYRSEHPSEKTVVEQESKLMATRQEAENVMEVDPHELQRRQRLRQSLENQASVPLYTDSHSSISEESSEQSQPGPYEIKIESDDSKEAAFHTSIKTGHVVSPSPNPTGSRMAFPKHRKTSEKVGADKTGSVKREAPEKKETGGGVDTPTGKKESVKLEQADRQTAGKIEQAAFAALSVARNKGKNEMKEGQDENDALEAAEDVRDELEHGFRNLPRKRKEPKPDTPKNESKLKPGSWFESRLNTSRPDGNRTEGTRRNQHRQQKEYQKKKLQRAYAKAFRGEKARTELEREAEKGFRKAGGKLRSVFLPTDDPMRKLFRLMLIVLLVILALTLLLQGMALFVASGNGVVLTTYPNSDEEIYAVENEYRRLEQALEAQLTTISVRYPGYQEYNMDLDDIGHDPYVLISYLTTYHWNFEYEDVEEEIQSLFEDQYELIVTPSTRQRNGKTIRTLEVRLINRGLDTVCRERMDEEQVELYDVLNTTKGNRDYLFNESNTGYGLDGYVNYSVPEEALNDEQFARMLREAEKYLGWPYVWGGSSPADGGFDCSGYVCWVVNNCGNGWNVGRTTAEGLRRMCAYVSPADARPGDLVFFQGTYNTEGASHIGIYVGDGMMINAGDPIKYASINTPYWQQHFMQFGRLPGANPGTSAAANSGFSEEDRRLLADCIYWEARGQSFECQCYVGQVILNRVYDRRYPNTIRGVIGQPGQYANGIRSSPEPCYAAADAVLSGKVAMPRNVIYQAQFQQGSGVWKYLEGEYFCYG